MRFAPLLVDTRVSSNVHAPFACFRTLRRAITGKTACALMPCGLKLKAEFGIQAAWWGQQPACTSKSGWITLGAHPKADKRVSFQIAACRLGLAVMQALPCDDHRYQ